MILPESQRLDATGSNYREWRARIIAIMEVYSVYDFDEPCGEGHEGHDVARSILILNMEKITRAVFSTRGAGLEIENMNAREIWRRLKSRGY